MKRNARRKNRDIFFRICVSIALKLRVFKHTNENEETDLHVGTENKRGPGIVSRTKLGFGPESFFSHSLVVTMKSTN